MDNCLGLAFAGARNLGTLVPGMLRPRVIEQSKSCEGYVPNLTEKPKTKSTPRKQPSPSLAPPPITIVPKEETKHYQFGIKDKLTAGVGFAVIPEDVPLSASNPAGGDRLPLGGYSSELSYRLRPIFSWKGIKIGGELALGMSHGPGLVDVVGANEVTSVFTGEDNRPGYFNSLGLNAANIFFDETWLLGKSLFFSAVLVFGLTPKGFRHVFGDGIEGQDPINGFVSTNNSSRYRAFPYPKLDLVLGAGEDRKDFRFTLGLRKGTARARVSTDIDISGEDAGGGLALEFNPIAIGKGEDFKINLTPRFTYSMSGSHVGTPRTKIYYPNIMFSISRR